jgi:hypothetical protein
VSNVRIPAKEKKENKKQKRPLKGSTLCVEILMKGRESERQPHETSIGRNRLDTQGYRCLYNSAQGAVGATRLYGPLSIMDPFADMQGKRETATPSAATDPHPPVTIDSRPSERRKGDLLNYPR